MHCYLKSFHLQTSILFPIQEFRILLNLFNINTNVNTDDNISIKAFCTKYLSSLPSAARLSLDFRIISKALALLYMEAAIDF
jgi:hypothetical protein